jgi:hypothetical protein
LSAKSTLSKHLVSYINSLQTPCQLYQRSLKTPCQLYQLSPNTLSV